MRENKKLPNFIVIGPGKSGTSWIYSILNQHPEVCVSSAKETLFFEEYYEKGFAWYAKFFKNCQTYHKAIGEVSNTYIFSPFTPLRIYNFNPKIKLISTLRNPVDRAFSHYLFHLRNGKIEGEFEKAIKEYPDLIQRGLYYKYLSTYLQYFSLEQILILFFDDLQKNPLEYSSKIFEFLEINNLTETKALTKKVLGASKPRSKILARSVKQAAQIIRKIGFPELITQVRASPLSKLLYQPYRKDEYPQINPETRQRLNEYYRNDVKSLSSLLGKDLESLWLS